MSGPKITLSGIEYELPEKFVLAQLREFGMISTRVTPESASEKEAYFYDQSVDYVVVALNRTETPLRSTDIMEMTITIPEVFAARRIILQHSGLLAKEEGSPTPGEDGAAVPEVPATQ